MPSGGVHPITLSSHSAAAGATAPISHFGCLGELEGVLDIDA